VHIFEIRLELVLCGTHLEPFDKNPIALSVHNNSARRVENDAAGQEVKASKHIQDISERASWMVAATIQQDKA
jgi:hypothetical protein